jgi:hypothetical protein
MADEPTPADPIDGAPEPEHVTAEVVEPGTDVVVPEPHPYSALERAADAALQLPGLAGRDEFLSLAMQARILAMSAGAPAAVRDNPHLAFHLAMIGRDLGISPTAALQMIDVIGYNQHATNYAERYKNVQLSISPELMNGQIGRLGLGRIVKAGSTAEQCYAVALAPGGHIDTRCARSWPDHVANDAPGGPCTCTHALVLGEVLFRWEDAQAAELAMWECRPGNHSENCQKNVRHQTCRQGYRTYPQRMMWWRAAGWAQSDLFPSASIGLYSPEELGAIVDDEGRAIDPATIELPAGYEPAEVPPDPNDQPWCEADPDGCADLERRLAAIGVAQGQVPVPSGDEPATGPRLALLELWAERDENDVPRLPPFRLLQRRHATKAKALVASMEARIKKAEWGDEVRDAWMAAVAPPAAEPTADAVAPQEPAAAPDADAPADGADAPEATTATPTADGDAEAEALAEYERAVATPTVTEQEVAAARQLATTPEAIAAEVVAMEPTDVLAKLGELLPDGQAVPRTKDGRHTLLIDLLLAQRNPEPEATAPADAPEPGTDTLL